MEISFTQETSWPSLSASMAIASLPKRQPKPPRLLQPCRRKNIPPGIAWSLWKTVLWFFTWLAGYGRGNPRDISPKSIKKARIDLPSLSTFPNFPTEVVFKNSRNLHPSSIRSSKQLPRDRFIRKVRVSADPSLVSNFMVMAIMVLSMEI